MLTGRRNPVRWPGGRRLRRGLLPWGLAVGLALAGCSSQAGGPPGDRHLDDNRRPGRIGRVRRAERGADTAAGRCTGAGVRDRGAGRVTIPGAFAPSAEPAQLVIRFVCRWR